jgi:hypothetical protein
MTAGSRSMVSAISSYNRAAERRDNVSWSRLLWVGPLTVAVALLVNMGIAVLLRAINPALNEMGQLGRPNVILTLEGAILAVIVFAVMVWLVPHPIRWYRIVGGDLRRTGSAMVSPFTRFGAQFFPASPGGGPPQGGPSAADVLPGLPWDRVLILMLLHVTTAAVCIVLLTTLTREPEVSRVRDPRTSGSRPLR